MRRLYLDRKSDGQPPSGAMVVENEVDFLRAFLDEQDLVVRGDALCKWAANVWLGRGWPLEQLLSPVDELADCAVEPDQAQIAQLYEEHATKLGHVSRPFRLQRVLESLYPEDRLWRGHPSIQHAASWLVWLDNEDPQGGVLALLRTQAMLWRATCKGDEAILYEACDAAKAREFLASWLGYGDSPPIGDLPPFPLDVPPRHVDGAARTWRSQIVTTRGQYVGDVLRRRLPRRLKERVAQLGYDYYGANQAHLTQEAIRLLADYLAPGKTASLRGMLPPPLPGKLPSDAPSVKRWFSEEYLPFRQWCLIGEESSGMQKCANLAREFAFWYLSTYPTAIASGNEDVSFLRASKVRSQHANGVTLFVIADGLCVIDAQVMIREIVAQDSRLSVSGNDLVFAPVPTITEICKPAIRNGVTPRDAENVLDSPGNVHILRENQDPMSVLKNASVGDFFMWSHLEPDSTYHSHADKQTLLDKVAGEVRTIATRIVKAAQAVPAHLRLRIIISTDHGRLLAKSERVVDIPQGMESHQRVALGLSDKPLPSAGYFVADDQVTVALDGRRFGFSEDKDCVIVLSDDSFLMNDGRSGAEFFPHGGLAPEEVLVPWCEIARDQVPPHVECTATGSAREARPGDVSIRCVNAGNIDVTIVAVEFQFRDKPTVEISVNVELPRMSEKVVNGRIDEWPTPSDLRAASAIARIRLPVGDEDSVPVELDLKSEGFYVREDILGDL